MKFHKLMRCAAVISLVIPLLLTGSATAAAAERVVIPCTADTALRDRAYADWNFGAGPLLEAGFMGGIYETHHAASLIRFDLSGAKAANVTSARLRLYRPKSFVQMMPVEVRVYEVRAGTAWEEGHGISEEDASGACWSKHGGAHVD